MVIGPFLTALAASERQTAAVAFAAVASVLLSATWNDTGLERRLLAARRGRGRRRRACRRGRPPARRAPRAPRRSARSSRPRSPTSPRPWSSRTTTNRLLYANDAAARTLGYASAEVLLTTPRGAARRRRRLLQRGRLAAERPRATPPTRVLRGEDPGPVTIRIVKRATGEERWRVTKARGVNDSRGRPRLVVSVIEDITERKRSELAQRLLSRTGDVLASSLDYEQTLQGGRRPRRARARRLVRGEHARPPGRHPAGRRRPQRPGEGRVRARLRAALPDARERRRAARRRSSATGRPQLIPEIPDELLEQAVEDPEQLELIRSLGMRSAAMVPMAAATGPPIGVISFVNAESGRVFTETDLELFEEIGRRAGIAIENARLYEERSHDRAHAAARAAAAGAARHPRASRLATLYRPAGRENWVGGDFYDAFAVRDGWMVVVGDVAGRGAPAASLTAYSRHVMRTAAQLHDDPLDAVDVPQPPALRAPRPGAVHALLRAAAGARPGRRGDHDLRRSPAAARDPPRPASPSRSGRWGTMLGAWTDGRVPAHDDDARRRRVARALHRRRHRRRSALSERYGEERLQAVLADAARARRRAAPDRGRARRVREGRPGRRHLRARHRTPAAGDGRRAARLGRVDVQALGGARRRSLTSLGSESMRWTQATDAPAVSCSSGRF